MSYSTFFKMWNWFGVMHILVWLKHIVKKWVVDPRRRSCPTCCDTILLVKTINQETKVIMVFLFLFLKKREIVKWYSVWPVYLTVILALEYTSLPTAKGSPITNQWGLEQTFALPLILLRYSASHAIKTCSSMKHNTYKIFCMNNEKKKTPK